MQITQANSFITTTLNSDVDIVRGSAGITADNLRGNDSLLRGDPVQTRPETDGSTRGDTLRPEPTRGDGRDGEGGGDHNLIRGTQRSDDIDGTDRTDAIYAGGGDDTVSAAGGNDLVRAGSGNDTVSGGSGDDKMGGGLGDDLLMGDSGNDYLLGGQGDDTLTGGEGSDHFYFKIGNANGTPVRGAGDDVITDFSAEEGDTIRVTGTQLMEANFSYGDADGDGIDDFTLITFEPNARIAETDVVDDSILGSITIMDAMLTEADLGF